MLMSSRDEQVKVLAKAGMLEHNMKPRCRFKVTLNLTGAQWRVVLWALRFLRVHCKAHTPDEYNRLVTVTGLIADGLTEAVGRKPIDLRELRG